MLFPMRSAIDPLLLGVEAQHAASLRLCRIGRGGEAAQDEAVLMVGEKIEAFGGALASLARGGTLDGVVAGYRQIVRANVHRLLEESDGMRERSADGR